MVRSAVSFCVDVRDKVRKPGGIRKRASKRGTSEHAEDGSRV